MGRLTGHSRELLGRKDIKRLSEHGRTVKHLLTMGSASDPKVRSVNLELTLRSQTMLT